MKDLHPLELSDRPTVAGYLRRYPPKVSELTFTNLFVWRGSRPIFLTEVQGSIVFMTNTNERNGAKKVIFGHPVGEASPVAVASALGVEVAGFIRIPEDTANTLRKAGLHVEPDRDNSDYVYRVRDLAELAGRRFHKKRNLIKQCLAAYACQYEPITPELIFECLDMQDRWCQVRQCERDPALCREYIAIRESFAHYEELQLIGGGIRVDGTIQAYAIGEALRPRTAVCHFEKAMPELHGLGQLINQWFAKHSLTQFEFENREQDLGNPGLRQAKESYHPHHMVEKLNAWFTPPTSDIPSTVEPRECDKNGLKPVVRKGEDISQSKARS
jgi:hypothetical protein